MRRGGGDMQGSREYRAGGSEVEEGGRVGGCVCVMSRRPPGAEDMN